MKWSGVVVADIVELRFAFSGKIVSLVKSEGEHVETGNVIASLDRKILQTELDRQLSDYEKTRAQFEMFKQKHGENVDKFLQQISQSELTAAVKDVELSKFKMDQADLLSPVVGTLIDLGGLRVGLFITPSSNPVKILDSGSLKFKFEILQSDLEKFLTPVKVKISFPKMKEKFEGTTSVPTHGLKGKFEILVSFIKTSNLLPGLVGEVST